MTKFTNRQFILAILILLLATSLRFYLLDNQSFWNDEGNTARLSERSIQLIIEGTASDIHPPLYYLILRGWREFVGETEFALRAFSAFVGVLLVAVTITFGRRWDTPRTGLIAGLLTAVSPPLIYYSQEARMYSLLGLFGVLSTWLYFEFQLSRSKFHVQASHAAEHNVKRETWQLGTLYILSLAAGLYTHYFFPAIIVVHNLHFVLSQTPRVYQAIFQSQKSSKTLGVSTTKTSQVWRDIGRWTLTMLAALTLYAPWLPIFIRNTGSGAGATSGDGFLLEAFIWLLFGPVLERAAFIAVFAIAITTVIRRLTFRFPDHLSLFWLWLVIPPLMMMLVGSVGQQFLKFLTAVAPAFALMLAIRITTLWEARIKGNVNNILQGFGYTLAAVLLLPLLYSAAVALNQLYHNPAYFRDDYRAIAAQITAQAPPDAGIILNAPNQWEVFTYYYDGDAEVYPFPQVNSSAAEITPELEQIAADHSRLYVLFWGEQGFDPERQVERWLDANAFKAIDEFRGDVRFASYAVPQAAATEMETAVHYPVGDAITLQGYTLNTTTFTPSDIVQLTLFWQATQPIDQRYKIFLHLIAFDGSLPAQRDSEPVGNLRPTTTWEPNETIIDNHGLLLPPDLPSGTYALHLGLYDLANPAERLVIDTAAGPTDSWRIATIAIK